ncbi:MAG: hypothetical protein J4F36_14125 [Nitrosopumilaceae archaeon]|nr:hypothetical protein [Nitrosopumilaceae archaeon]
MTSSFFLFNYVKPLTLFSIILLVPFGIVHADHYGAVDTAVDDGDYEFSNRTLDFSKVVFDPIFEGDDRVTGYLDLRSNTASAYRIVLDIEEHDGSPDSHHTFVNPLNGDPPDRDYFDIDISNLSFDTVDQLRFDVNYDIGNVAGFDRYPFTNEDIPIQEPRHCTWTDMPGSLNYDAASLNQIGTVTWNPTNNSATYNADPTTVEFSIGAWVDTSNRIAVNAEHTSIDGNYVDANDIITVSNVGADHTFTFSTILDFISANLYAQNIGKNLSQTVTVAAVCD